MVFEKKVLKRKITAEHPQDWDRISYETQYRRGLTLRQKTAVKQCFGESLYLMLKQQAHKDMDARHTHGDDVIHIFGNRVVTVGGFPVDPFCIPVDPAVFLEVTLFM